MSRVLLAGVSTRAAAASAVRAGFDVVAVDAFGDLDHPTAADVRVVRPFSAAAAARAADGIRCDAVAYLSGFENHPAAVRRLAAGRTLWGNAPEVLRRVRHPEQLAATLRAAGLPAPEIWPASSCESPSSGVEWLVKPRASGGGHGIRPLRRDGAGRPRPWSRTRSYVQERIAGVPASVVFVAARGRAVVLGVSRQIVGDAAFGAGASGASAFRYCGSILAAMPPAFMSAASQLAGAVAKAFDLVGVNGIDVIAAGDQPVAIEVNPRWSASMELVERAHGISVFGAHAAACGRNELPAFEAGVNHAMGKAVVFAREDVVMGDTSTWLDDGGIADVPCPGERIARGRPICTVFAAAAHAAACYETLVTRASAIYGMTVPASPGGAMAARTVGGPA
jgi:hypothetical protein